MVAIMEIVGTGTVQRIVFASREQAEAELAKFAPKLGKDFFGRNDESGASHVINSPAGSVVIALNKITSAAVIDSATHRDLLAADNARLQTDQIDYRVRLAAALAPHDAT